MSGFPKTVAIGAAGDYNIGEAAGGTVSSWLLHFDSASFNGSVTIKGAGVGSGTTFTAQAVHYTDRADGTAAATAITGDKVVLVDSSGLDIVLDCTSYTSGTLNVYAVPVRG